MLQPIDYDEWVTKPVGEISDNCDSLRVSVKASDRKPGPYPYYGAQRVLDYIDGYLFDGEFVLVAEDVENLRARKENICLLASGRFWVNKHAHVLKGNSRSDTRFLCYAINSVDISGYVAGLTIPKLSKTSLNRLHIPWPSQKERQAIAAVLGALDDIIELNRSMNATLDAMALAMFKYLFVDFGPTRAKAADCPATLCPEIWSLFPAALDDEDKPVGWEEKPLTACFTIISGRTPPKSVAEYWGGLIPWATAGDLSVCSDVFIVSTLKNITEKWVGSGSSKRIPQGATIISTRGKVGKPVMACQEMFVNESCFGLRGHETFGDYFVYLLAQHMEGRLQSMAYSTAIPGINKQTFRVLKFVTPSSDVLESFEAIVQPLFARIRANVSTSQTLAQLRDTLRPKLMTGRIRIAGAETLAQEAL